jgi:hypothetical protein
VIDLSDPEDLEVVERFEVPSQLAQGGWGYGVSGCSLDMGWGWWGGGWGAPSALVSGDIVVSQHEEAVGDGSGRVRYYLDRLDVSNPASPELLPQVNIPGNVVHFDNDSGRIVTIDYLLDERPARNWDDCYDGNFNGYFDEEARVCRTYRRRLNVLDLEGETALLRDSRVIDEDTVAGSSAVSDDRIFFNVSVWDEDPSSNAPPKNYVRVLSYDASGDIDLLDQVQLESGWWYGQLVARDGRAFLTGDNELTVIDATGSSAEVTRHEMPGWWCSQLEVQNDVAYCAMGQYGVMSFELD